MTVFLIKGAQLLLSIGWLPLGGYVKIAGMIDESMDTEQLSQEPQPWEFRSKPAWQRLIIMLGGVTVNFLLAFFLFIMMLFVWGTKYSTKDDIKYGYAVAKTLENYGFKQGDKVISINGKPFEELTIDINKYIMFRKVNDIKVEHPDGSVEDIKIPEDIGTQLFEAGDLPALTPRYPFEIDSITPGSPAEIAGLLPSDKIVEINGNPINFYSDLTYHIKNSDTDELLVKVERNNELIDLKIKPNEDKIIGIYAKPSDLEFIKFHQKDYSLSESVTAGINNGYWEVKDYLSQFKYIFTKKGATQIGGFAAIGNMFPPVWNWHAFWYLTAFLSIMLGVLNLLPIPALDGGHVMFLLYEMISGRKPGDKFMEYAQMVGFFILIALVLFANGNDIYKAIFG